MADINSITLSGRINSDFKHINDNSGKVQISFELAVECWDGSKQLKPQIFYVKAKNSKAKYLLDYASKGDALMVSGMLKNYEYAEKETQKKRVITYISLSDCKFFKRN